MFFSKKDTSDAPVDSEDRTIKLKSAPLEPKRHRAQPKKPFGRRERLIVFTFVLVTSFSAFSLATTARHGKLPGLPRLSGEGLGMNETVVLTKSQAPKAQRQQQNETITQFAEATSDLSGVYSFVAVDLQSGDTYGVNEFESMQAASLMKLPLMSALFKESEEGRINLDAVYTLKVGDRIGGAGSLQYQEPGTQVTYRKLLELMGKQSDNTAFGIVRTKLGETYIQEFIEEMGMKHTDFAENMTTPSDMALILQKLYDGRVISMKSRDEMFSYLTDTQYEQHLPKGVPADINVVHKYGKEVHVVNDAGIVMTPRPYVIVIMTAGVVETEADAAFPGLSKIVYDGQSS